MKRLIVILLACGLAAGTLVAQDNTDKKDAPKQEVKKEKAGMDCCCTTDCRMDGKKESMKDCKMMKSDKKTTDKTETRKDEPKK